MHCGDMNEALISFTGMELTGDAAVDALSRTVADAYGLDYLVIGPLPGSTTTCRRDPGIAASSARSAAAGQWPEADVGRPRRRPAPGARGGRRACRPAPRRARPATHLAAC